jgi:predicted PurR-regulated permease PerM
MFLTPKLVGDRIGLHPVAVIFAVMAGGTLFGFTGVLLALPVSAVIMVLLRHAHDRYLGSSFYAPASPAEMSPAVVPDELLAASPPPTADSTDSS